MTCAVISCADGYVKARARTLNPDQEPEVTMLHDGDLFTARVR